MEERHLERENDAEEVSKLKILDPACGSGTFPLGAFQYLLDWHLNWYMENDPEKLAKGKNPPIFETNPLPASPKSAHALGREDFACGFGGVPEGGGGGS